ncbi:MAG: 16S rRNA (guanine(966)-N(2))-methyltransferase RsmD [Burkholderiaceae bacterium]
MSRRPTASASQEVRIIGGRWKRTPLPVAQVEGLRPTPGRVRETLFNWLGQDLTGLRCLDVFAGTGALGLEAASRGAVEVVLVEQDAALVRSLAGLASKLRADTVRVERGDGVSALRQRRGQAWDLVLLDPPFGGDGNPTLFSAALEAASEAIHPDGEIYLEAPVVWTDADLAPFGLQVHRCGKAGMVAFHLLRPIGAG